MNRLRRWLILAGLVAMAAMGIYPPWVQTIGVSVGRNKAQKEEHRYGWIFRPPRQFEWGGYWVGTKRPPREWDISWQTSGSGLWKVVNVPGIGIVEFPDTMRNEEIVTVIETKLLRPVRTILDSLDPLTTPDSVKGDAWDAYCSATTPNDFQRRFDRLEIPRETKALLWDLRFSGKESMRTPVFGPLPPLPAPARALLPPVSKFRQAGLAPPTPQPPERWVSERYDTTERWHSRIDFSRLLLQWVLVAMLAGGAAWAVGSRSTPPPR